MGAHDDVADGRIALVMVSRKSSLCQDSGQTFGSEIQTVHENCFVFVSDVEGKLMMKETPNFAQSYLTIPTLKLAPKRLAPRSKVLAAAVSDNSRGNATNFRKQFDFEKKLITLL